MQRPGAQMSRLVKMGRVFFQGHRILGNAFFPSVLGTPHSRAAPTATTDVDLALAAYPAPVNLVTQNHTNNVTSHFAQLHFSAPPTLVLSDRLLPM